MDSEKLAYLFLNPWQIHESPLFLVAAGVGAAIMIYIAWFIIFKIKRIPIFLLRVVTGIFGASIILIALFAITSSLPIEDYLSEKIMTNVQEVIHESDYLLVKVTADGATLFDTPSTRGKAIRILKKGMLFLRS